MEVTKGSEGWNGEIRKRQYPYQAYFILCSVQSCCVLLKEPAPHSDCSRRELPSFCCLSSGCFHSLLTPARGFWFHKLFLLALLLLAVAAVAGLLCFARQRSFGNTFGPECAHFRSVPFDLQDDELDNGCKNTTLCRDYAELCGSRLCQDRIGH